MSAPIALVSARASVELDEDLPILLAAAAARRIEVHVACWDDENVDWSRFSCAVLRSPWDYHLRLPEFLAWLARVEPLTALRNSADTVRWSIDKRYLAEVAEAGIPVTPTTFVAPPATSWTLPAGRELVVKPAVSAGSTNTTRHHAENTTAIDAEVARLLGEGRTVLIQPYLASVDSAGETALVYLGGEFSHAARKGPMLAAPIDRVGALYAREEISPRVASHEELALGQAAIDHVRARFGTPAYARVDVLPGADGPVLLELELAEPSLFLPTCPAAAGRLLDAVAGGLAGSEA